MFEHIGYAIKIFLEKHLIPTVISIVVAIISLLIFPENYWMIIKVGKNLFFLLVSGIIFLFVQLIVFMAKRFSSFNRRMSENLEYNRIKQEETNKNIEEWLSFVDDLPPSERELILKFIQNGNTPIVQYAYQVICHSYQHNSIYNDYIVKTEQQDGTILVKLNEQFYKVMKIIYESRGSISHF